MTAATASSHWGRASVPVGVGSTFAYDGETVTIAEMHGSAYGNDVRVTDRGGQRTYWLSLRELMSRGRLLFLGADAGPRSDDDVQTAGTILAALTEAQRAEVADKADHVREVLTGYRSGSPELALWGEPRARYAPELSEGVRRRAKAAELGKHDRTIRRWIDYYRAHGEAGLASTAQGNPLGYTDRRWMETAVEIMLEYRNASRPSRKSILLQIAARLARQHGPDVVPLPSTATAYRRFIQIDKLVPTFRGSRERNRDVAGRQDREYGQLNPTRPGEYMVLDTNSLDVFALDPVTLTWVNAQITVVMDAYSRCIVGIRVTPTTKSLDVAMALFQAFRPNPAPPSWPEHAIWPEHGIPRAVFADVDGLAGRTGTSSPAIVPDWIVIDHGKQFKCQHINSVCQRMGISIQPARLRTATDKGIVERFFLTMRMGLLQLQPGYKGPDVYSRGVNPEEEAFWYLDELEALIRHWIATVYHHTPHDSLFDPSISSHNLTPAQMFQHGVERAGYIEAPRDPDLAFEFLRPERRIIHHYGIRYRGRVYNGPGLNGLRGIDGFFNGVEDRHCHIYANPDDITRVYFRHPETRSWHTLFWKDIATLDMPMNEDGATYARKLAKSRGTSTDPAVALQAMLAEWNLDLSRTRAERHIALRLARERAALVDDLVTDDEEQARAFIEALRTQEPSAPPTAHKRTTDDHDDLDAFVDEEDADDEDDVDDDTFYADAFGDEPWGEPS